MTAKTLEQTNVRTLASSDSGGGSNEAGSIFVQDEVKGVRGTFLRDPDIHICSIVHSCLPSRSKSKSFSFPFSQNGEQSWYPGNLHLLNCWPMSQTVVVTRSKDAHTHNPTTVDMRLNNGKTMNSGPFHSRRIAKGTSSSTCTRGFMPRKGSDPDSLAFSRAGRPLCLLSDHKSRSWLLREC